MSALSLKHALDFRTLNTVCTALDYLEKYRKRIKEAGRGDAGEEMSPAHSLSISYHFQKLFSSSSCDLKFWKSLCEDGTEKNFYVFCASSREKTSSPGRRRATGWSARLTREPRQSLTSRRVSSSKHVDFAPQTTNVLQSDTNTWHGDGPGGPRSKA